MLTSCTGICMYKQPLVILASSKVFTLDTLVLKINAANGCSGATA